MLKVEYTHGSMPDSKQTHNVKKPAYKINVAVWLYPGDYANWHFVTIPKVESAQIAKKYAPFRKGWGSLPVVAILGETEWKTSIFTDSKSGTYILPLKALVRKKE